LTYTNDEPFVMRELYPKLREIIEHYLAGTRYGIRVESDGLVHAGEPGTQLTWMDAKTGDRVVTPRIGKPVEIQALWHNALRIQQELAQKAGDAGEAEFLGEMAEYVRTNFNRLFWNDGDQCLYDVVNSGARDASIRPNQILAVSLRYPIVDRERGILILRAVEKHLLTPMGLRSLAPSDAAYRPEYRGGAAERDSAYHQGTVWPWLMGPFVTAYLRVHAGSSDARDRVERWLNGFGDHLRTAGLGQISEVADGNPPHAPGGCIAQAWSVGELLRAITEAATVDGRDPAVAASASNGRESGRPVST
jgi:predicted glycogen debranching enzyme